MKRLRSFVFWCTFPFQVVIAIPFFTGTLLLSLLYSQREPAIWEWRNFVVGVLFWLVLLSLL